ncbi:uncharacterized protein LOC111802657 [Cucurbita pepo subsp. pepo]|uniref:uncharacterized protein LOC111802657 n=1 Tax=Cucurbita pepo subsp. pepo TaxID=3664 RepID=UPI000C9D3F37|nr:uncharacterized protein LOC111802657 [Cucurbita pepo subsp. pepo]XP_023542865.1 uncharacterized protein LOC111802657 [Cucurbita pepo subsp. pepo]XP_023542866.1 uncharacterized protein LOC111802657 [Cucurbita pepo subsp. pepo]
MAAHPIKILYLFPALFLPLFAVCEIASFARPSNDGLVDDLLEIKLRISRLESVLEGSKQNLTEKGNEIVAQERLIEAMSHKIQYLESALFDMKRKTLSHDERIAALEDEVRLLWAVLRKNNFDIHLLKVKAHEAEEKLEEVTSQVEKMSNIVSEQWIHIRHLEQALEITKINALKVRQQVALTRCTFLKLVNTRFINQLQKALQTLNYHLFSKVPTLSSMVTGAIQYFQGVYEEAKKYHHELQRLIKQEMERRDYAAYLVNREVIFFLASAIVTFPIFGAWMFLSSWFSR